MQNEIIVNVSSGETRVALLERSQFAELHIERAASKGVVGNVVKGCVSRVLPGMQAAFVDIGLEKAGFLYVGDYFAEPDPGASAGDGNGRAGGRGKNGRGGRGGRGGSRQPPPIDSVLREGQEIVVQIAKEPIGSKGARITSHVSIAGRHLVLTPWSPRVGVSRRIDSDKERRRLREIVERLRPRDLGFIIRTAGDGLKESDLEADIRYLTTVWNEVQENKETGSAPSVLYTEPDLPQRVLRDFANDETKRIVIDDDDTYARLREFAKRFVSDPQPKIEHYRGKDPIFDDFDLESQIHANLERKVRLKSGGSLVIDQSEALTAIDVNSGRYVGKSDLEETVFRTNLEAVKEVVKQLRFRNIGGLIIIDLIDMESRENREKVYRALQDSVRGDKAKTNILKISELGLVEMTRKRTRENLVQALCEPCANCEGRGYVLSSESVAFKVLREIRKDLPRFCGREIAITVAPQVATQLLGPERDALRALSDELGRDLEVRSRPGVHQEQFEITARDQGPPVEIALRWLGDVKPEEEEEDLAVEPEEPGAPDALAGGYAELGESDSSASDFSSLDLSDTEVDAIESDDALPEPPQERSDPAGGAASDPPPAAAPTGQAAEARPSGLAHLPGGPLEARAGAPSDPAGGDGEASAQAVDVAADSGAAALDSGADSRILRPSRAQASEPGGDTTPSDEDS